MMMRVVRSFYTVCFYLLLPLIFMRLWWKGRRLPAYRRGWLERFAFVKIPDEYRCGIWIHAASVGEVVAASMIVKNMRDQGDKRPVIMTTMTPTGAEQVKRSFKDRDYYKVHHVLVPYDLPCAIRRFLDHARPKVLMLIETEIWPNLLAEAKRYYLPCLLVNARLSERSKQGYQRLKGFSTWMMQQFDLILAQTSSDAERFISLGAEAEKVKVCGNVKYDLAWPEGLAQKAQELRTLWGAERPVVVVASTHKGEEAHVLKAFEHIWQKHPETLLVLVPRHPNRFAEVKKICQENGRPMACRSEMMQAAPNQQTMIYLGDSMGEMGLYYQLSDIAVVAGSFAAIGGHNMLEPASLGKAVVTGPHVFNFSQVSALLLQQQAALQVERADDAELLAQTLLDLINKPEKCQQMGQNGQAAVAAHQGASQRTVDHLWQVMKAKYKNEQKS